MDGNHARVKSPEMARQFRRGVSTVIAPSTRAGSGIAPDKGARGREQLARIGKKTSPTPAKLYHVSPQAKHRSRLPLTGCASPRNGRSLSNFSRKRFYALASPRTPMRPLRSSALRRRQAHGASRAADFVGRGATRIGRREQSTPALTPVMQWIGMLCRSKISRMPGVGDTAGRIRLPTQAPML